MGLLLKIQTNDVTLHWTSKVECADMAKFLVKRLLPEYFKYEKPLTLDYSID